MMTRFYERKYELNNIHVDKIFSLPRYLTFLTVWWTLDKNIYFLLKNVLSVLYVFGRLKTHKTTYFLLNRIIAKMTLNLMLNCKKIEYSYGYWRYNFSIQSEDIQAIQLFLNEEKQIVFWLQLPIFIIFMKPLRQLTWKTSKIVVVFSPVNRF